MTFSQLHYTSCKDGLSGYSGFQFCAATPGVPREIMREVERRTIYELPSVIRETEAESIDDFPVNLIYTRGQGADVFILSRVQFTGLDFSNRSGNYFAHSLVTDRPADLRSSLPIEFWESPFWQSRQGPDTELAPLAEPPPPGPLTRRLIAGFLASQDRSGELTASLLTAADQAIGAGRQLLLVGPDTQSVCHWIAAVSYLLEPALARQMTFSTYSYDPRRCLTHVVGTISAARPLRADISAGFHVFDPARDLVPDLPASPSAQLLARLGVDAVADLWRLAVSLGAPPGAPLSDAYPILAGAALISGQLLLPGEFSMAIDWLATAGPAVSADRMRAAAASALRQPLGELPARQQERLIELAARTDDARPREGSLAAQIECGIVAGALGRVDRGQPPGEGIRLRTEAARKEAANGCSQRLPGCELALALDVLNWASAVGVTPDAAAIGYLGRAAVFEALLRGQISPQLVEAAGRWPALRAGILQALTTYPVARQESLVGGAAGPVFQLEDFADQAALGKAWITGMMASGRMTRTAALTKIVALGHGRAIDDDLINRLWRNHSWTPREATELIGLLSQHDLAGAAVTSRLIALLHAVPASGDPGDWMEFVDGLSARCTAILPDDEAALAQELSEIFVLTRNAGEYPPRDESIEALVRRYGSAHLASRSFLDHWAAPLLLQHSRLWSLLEKCPNSLFIFFRDFAADALANKQLSYRKIASIFVAMNTLKNRNSRYSAMLDKNVLRPTLAMWRTDEIKMIGVDADQIMPHSSRQLENWHLKVRPKRFRLMRSRS